MTPAMQSIVAAITRMEGADGPGSVNTAILRKFGLHNPGHIIWSQWSQRHGATPCTISSRVWAGWPTRVAGEQAIADLLTTYAHMWPDISIKEAVSKYAPPSENNSERYAILLGEWTGLDILKPLADVVGG